MIYSNQKNLLLRFIFLISILITIGLIFIYSSSSVYALEKFSSAHYYVKKQIFGVILGLIGLIIIRYIPLNIIKFLTPPTFIFMLVLSILPVITGLGQSIHGSARWINLMGISFQPSEFLKMAYITYISYILSKKKFKVISFANGYLPLLIIMGITVLTLLKQPDFGQAVTLTLTSFLLFFVADCQLKHILATVALAIPAGLALILFKSYRLKRIMIFMDPWQDPKGAGFQIIQSLIAIGSGHITGVGIAQSKQKFFYLPMHHTDFIFSIIAEETGFIGCSILILIYILFLYTGIKLASTFSDPFCYYSTLSFIFLTTIQTIVNISVATGLLPTKGLGLPFISYGNSALIANLCMLGLIINFFENDKN